MDSDNREGTTDYISRFEFPENEGRVMTALFGAHVNPTYRNCVKGVLSKIKAMDINMSILHDTPLKVVLSPGEYQEMFPCAEKSIADIFEESVKYYSEKTNLAVTLLKSLSGEKHINVIDGAWVNEAGEIEILFTRSILPFLGDIKYRLNFIDVTEFNLLSNRYSQKLYEVFSRASLVLETLCVEVDSIRALLKVPEGYSDYKLRTIIVLRAVKEINKKTKIQVLCSFEKGERGKAVKFIRFVIVKQPN